MVRVLKQNKKHIILWLIYSMVMFNGWFSKTVVAQEARPESPIHLSVQQSLTNRLVLCFSLENTGGKSVRLSRNDVPWYFRPCMILILVNARNQEIIKETSYIEDPLTGRDTLMPNELIAGTLELNSSRWPDLLEILKHDDVIVFWSYEPRFTCDVKYARQGGCIVVQSDQVKKDSRRIEKE